MTMLYYVKNSSGNVSDVTERIYNDLKGSDEYECWTEDPYENLPDEVAGMQKTSTDYTAKEAREIAKEMNPEDRAAFIGDDEDRVTVTRLLD